MFNPQGLSYNKLMSVAWDFDFIKQNMNIYKNNFVLNEYMKDNSIHWLNLIAQSDYKLMHIDIYSLPVFLDTLMGKALPSAFYKMPVYLSLLFSGGIIFIKGITVIRNIIHSSDTGGFVCKKRGTYSFCQLA